MPKGDEFDVELPVYSTGKEIKEELISANIAPRTNIEGIPFVYRLLSKTGNLEIEDEKTLDDFNIRNGETLYLAPIITVG